MYHYFVFGLNIESEIPFIGLADTQKSLERATLQIALGEVPQKLNDAKVSGAAFSFKEESYLLDIEGVARYLIDGKSQIMVQLYPEAEIQDVSIFLCNSVLPVALSYNGFLVMHASAVSINGKAILFAGGSGTGKSSLAACFYKNGYAVLSDELLVVKVSSNKQVLAYPSFPVINLWENTLEKIGYQDETLESQRTILSNKKTLKLDSNFVQTPLPIEGLFVLGEHKEGEVVCKELNGFERLTVLRKNIFMRKIVEEYAKDIKLKHFQIINMLLSQTKVFTLHRPTIGNSLQATFEKVIKTVDEYNG